MGDSYVDSPRSPSPTPFPATDWQLLNYLIGEANDGAERGIRHSRLLEEIDELKTPSQPVYELWYANVSLCGGTKISNRNKIPERSGKSNVPLYKQSYKEFNPSN